MATAVTEDKVKGAISSGDIKMKSVEVTAEVNGKSASENLDVLEVVNYAGALAYCGGNDEKVWEKFNRQILSEQKANVYQALRNDLLGPDKAIEASAKKLVAAKLFPDVETAVAAIKAASQK